MLWFPIISAILVGVDRQSMIQFFAAFVYASMFCSAFLLLSYIFYRAVKKFTKNNCEWFVFFWRTLTGQRASYKSSLIMTRVWIASFFFVSVGLTGIYATVVTFWLVGWVKGLVFLIYFAMIWPAISFNLVVYVKGDQGGKNFCFHSLLYLILLR